MMQHLSYHSPGSVQTVLIEHEICYSVMFSLHLVTCYTYLLEVVVDVTEVDNPISAPVCLS